MFKTVIVASDLSPASDQVIGCLHGLKPLGTERIILTHALGIRHLEDMKHELAPLAIEDHPKGSAIRADRFLRPLELGRDA